MDIDTFIERWSAARGGAERANYQMFLTELCEALDLPRPDPASDDTRTNDYVFERGVKRRESEGLASTLRIDLYKRGCFILEAKQSRAAHRDDGQGALFKADETASTAASQGKWDVLMRNARRQAEDYVFRLPADHAAPPFIIVCDVGYVFEVYADFSGSGRAYSHFPDRKGFRVRLEDLRDEKIVKRLKAIWTEPLSLDPTRESARVTRQIAERLAEVSKRLEKKYPEDEVAHFLMRCIFTMFAEDVDLLPRGRFTALLKDQLDHPESFAPMLQALWKSMDAPDYEDRFYAGFGLYVKHFNGSLFKNAKAFPLGREEIGELLAAAGHDWRYVEPAIFGTLVEQALKPGERRKLGAHYTPRSYVERLVEVTVMEPLRGDWNAALVKAGDARERGEHKEAVGAVRAFHHQLCSTRVLDPACGTGNFLYVSLELMKRLEGEVLEALAELGETETIGFETVDPHQFLGIELHVRAAAIAELVLWIGYLQQHYRNSVEHPAQPILKAFGNIQQKDAVLTWDGYPELQFEMRDGVAVQVYPNARRPDWPTAEFIVGNPPFIGGKDLRSRMMPGYAEALWKAHPHMNESADIVMYWWDRSAEVLSRKNSKLRRFGFVTTNSIRQPFLRRTIERYLEATRRLSIVYAVPDHPWTKATRDSASVRIAMTVAALGDLTGMVDRVVSETGIDTDEPSIVTSREVGAVHSDLTVGTNTTKVVPLLANTGLSTKGVIFLGDGFLIDDKQFSLLRSEDESGSIIKDYVSGSDFNKRHRHLRIIDLDGIDLTTVRSNYPRIFGHLYERVKPVRDKDRERYRRENWWLFGRRNTDFREARMGLERYIITTVTSRNRFFGFMSANVMPDQTLLAVLYNGSDVLSLLSSRIHVTWAVKVGGFLGIGNDPRYSKSKTFDPFPFPDPSDAIRARLCDLGEELDATRKTVQAEHPDLTLTGLYNVLEKIRAGTPLDAKDQDVKERGRVLILKDLHDQIDRATADAYGWPHDLSDEQILERLVALNAERAAEEAAGHVRWLRPDYQIPRFAKGAAAKSGQLDLGESVVAIDKSLPVFPKDKGEQAMAIHAVLEAAHRPMDAAAVSRAFKGGGKKIEQRVVQALSTLVRYGWITALPGGTYAARRAA
ncbi:MAG: class I SAM-dependent DNA methyltransferase [Brevundimonas sp.]|uniref:class I SAM-dependent DNA methyltransferase n=1 Tax=Brevundimonas sp. TaxID=1871086 RepID=UPI001A2C7080|nr:DNA methyltransferase [Brevundimonas sp.]MBJ7319702.1 class I SAM-dependent DNA methyltransferase [Brevundimonas sp.]